VLVGTLELLLAVVESLVGRPVRAMDLQTDEFPSWIPALKELIGEDEPGCVVVGVRHDGVHERAHGAPPWTSAPPKRALPAARTSSSPGWSRTMRCGRR
jgi:hypothetical protein